MAGKEAAKATLLVLTSTYPRWLGDPEPGFVHELAKRLTGRFQVIVLGPHAPGARLTEEMEGVEVVRYRYAPESMETLVNGGGIVTNLKRRPWKLLVVPSFFLSQVWHSWKLLRTRKVDVIHAHWLIPQGITAAILQVLPGRSVPYVATSHGADLFALQGRFLNYLKRVVMLRSCSTTVVSEAMRRSAVSLDPGANLVSVQPMGVDMDDRFVPDPASVRSDDELLFVGRLVEKKGLRHLLKAMPAVVAKRPTVRLRIAGFGPEEDALKRQAESLGLASQVVFLGAVSQADLPALYRRAALLIAPFVMAGSGDQEGLGLVVVEAIGCGCPVVAGDVAGAHDVLGSCPHRLVDVRDASALSALILDVLADPQRARDDAEQLRSELIERFNWQQVAEGYARSLTRCGNGIYRDGVLAHPKT